MNKTANNAIYSWWTGPLAVNRYVQGEKTFLAYVDSEGTMGIMVWDQTTGTHERTELAQFEQDDHNAPAIAFMADGRVVVFYARHNKDHLLRYRISLEPESISAFGKEHTIESQGTVTYIQALAVTDTELTILWRSGSCQWSYATFACSADIARGVHEGFNTSEKIWLDAGAGLYYLQAVLAPDRSIRLFMYGHPLGEPERNEIRYGSIDEDGNIHAADQAPLGRINDLSVPLHPTDFQLAYRPSAGHKVRLLDVAHGTTPRFVAACFSNTQDAMYREFYLDGAEFLSSEITAAGIPIEVPAGGNYYFGGASFVKADDQTIYLSREAEERWSIEQWVKDETSWRLSQTIAESDAKLFRPYTLFNAVDGYRVAYVHGQYLSYTDYSTDIILT